MSAPPSSSSSSHEVPVSIVFFLVMVMSLHTVSSHVIKIRSPNLFPISCAWDPNSQHFVVSSLSHHSIKAISDRGIVRTIFTDNSLPPMVSILGLTIDPTSNRLLAILHAFEPLPPLNALAAYDLTSGEQLFLTLLTHSMVAGRRQIAIDIAVDHAGNAYVTNTAGRIWKVEAAGKPSIFSKSDIFSPQHMCTTEPNNNFNSLSGIAYVSKGFLLVVQTHTGKLFKVDPGDGTARMVKLTEDLTEADRIAVRNDGVVVVISKTKAWFLKSKDDWDRAVIYDEIGLDVDKLPISVAVGEENRTFVLYKMAKKDSLGSLESSEFSIEEITGSGKVKGKGKGKGKKEEADHIPLQEYYKKTDLDSTPESPHMLSLSTLGGGVSGIQV